MLFSRSDMLAVVCIHTEHPSLTHAHTKVQCVWPAGFAQRGGINRMVDMRMKPNSAGAHGPWLRCLVRFVRVRAPRIEAST